MANEILKNEILSDKQLEGVAGGTWSETEKDERFMREIGITVPATFRGIDVEVKWAKLGITSILHESSTDRDQPNEYYYQGKAIPRAKAIEIAMKKTKSKIDPRPYY